MSYPFDSIWINQRKVLLDAILQGQVNTTSEHEASTFTFIRAWLKGEDSFTLQTSGSTGPPKNITFTRNQMQASAARTVKALGLEQGITSLVCLNTKYIAGKMMLVRALEHGLKIIAVDPASDPYQQISASQPIDFMAVAPLQLQTLLDNPKYFSRLNSMKAILVGGAPVNLSLKTAISNLTCPVYETYGMTETLSNIALKHLNGAMASDYFTPLPGITLSRDNRDCLIIHDSIQHEPLITNDVVELHENGFRWLGRADNVINSGGLKIYPEKVESALENVFQSLEIPRKYFIGSLPDERLGEAVTLFIEGSDISKSDILRLQKGIDQLPEKMERPRKAATIAAFQYTPTGKIIRKRIPEGNIRLITEFVTH